MNTYFIRCPGTVVIELNDDARIYYVLELFSRTLFFPSARSLQLIQCYTMAQSRNDAPAAVPVIGLKEVVLFLMKDHGRTFDTKKIVRLMKHFQLKDSIANSSEVAFDTMMQPSAGNFDGTMDQEWATDQSVSQLMDTVNVHGQQKSNKGKSSRIETCIKILKELDPSAEILDTFSDVEYVDTIKMDRNVVSIFIN